MALRVLSLNLWHDQGPWHARAKVVRRWIERLSPDVIGFQEVLRGPGVDLAADVLGDLPYHVAFAEATRFWRDPALSFGNAIASRFPILDRATLALPHGEDGERRVALAVALDAPIGRLGVTCTHLHWKLHHGYIRERQVVAVCDFARRTRPSRAFPPILVGDFNAEPDSAEIRYATGLQSLGGKSMLFYDAWRVAGERRGPDDAGVTWCNRNPHARAAHEPDRRIDYVLVGYPTREGVGKIESCRVVCDEPDGDVWPSDHFGVLAALRSEPA
ncbi:MAG TPA: endonuclease/exonuclease/phosphatase family protein [Myxococcota bacterium]|jgi:endonuclease/exonuclease/phosphatase family metal-dependent hydrolase|nr:endonuclease/exonuclease/phosphatase family protein [Myxococcota bacterium]